MNTLGLLQSKVKPEGLHFALQETRSIHDSMNIPKGLFDHPVGLEYKNCFTKFFLSVY